MKSPLGYPTPSKACKLIKNICTFKHSSREWFYAHFSKALIKIGFSKINFDAGVFIDKTGEVVIAIYVDDLLIFYLSIERKNQISLLLHSKFEMMGTGTANWALENNLIHTNTGIILSQEVYLTCVLLKYAFDESKPVATSTNQQKTGFDRTSPRAQMSNFDFPAQNLVPAPPKCDTSSFGA